MLNIQDTHASRIVDEYGREKVKITRLAGNAGEPLKLYIDNSEYKALPVLSRPFFSIDMELAGSSISIRTASNNPLSPLTVKDHFRFIALDGRSMETSFNKGGKLGDCKINFSFLPLEKLLFLMENKISVVKVYNHKVGIFQTYDFESVPNPQYNSKEEGSLLLRVIATRLSGLAIQKK